MRAAFRLQHIALQAAVYIVMLLSSGGLPRVGPSLGRWLRLRHLRHEAGATAREW